MSLSRMWAPDVEPKSSGRPSLLPAEPSCLPLKEDFDCGFAGGGGKQKGMGSVTT